MKKKLRWIIPLLVFVLLALTMIIYFGHYYRADDAAKAALVSDNVQVSQTGSGWLFDGESENYALIFYPGAKVEETAYAPLCHKLASEGIDVFLISMPLHFALFDSSAAGKIITEYDYCHWYIGGHSLGGVAAAEYASGNSEELEGIIFFASYSSEKLDGDLNTILIYGSEDNVLNLDKYYECLNNVPSDSTQHIIEGGNHSQFGSYGFQNGDGTALITAEEQIEEACEVITDIILP